LGRLTISMVGPSMFCMTVSSFSPPYPPSIARQASEAPPRGGRTDGQAWGSSLSCRR
jgi:hypothetical protein